MATNRHTPRDTQEENVHAWIEKLLAQAPPLTDAERVQLRMMLTPPEPFDRDAPQDGGTSESAGVVPSGGGFGKRVFEADPEDTEARVEAVARSGRREGWEGEATPGRVAIRLRGVRPTPWGAAEREWAWRSALAAASDESWDSSPCWLSHCRRPS
jgi:hypothetical protein